MHNIGSQGRPNAQQNGQRTDHCGREDERDDLGRVLGVRAEDVVNFRGGGVTLGRGGEDERDVGVAGDGQVKNLLFVGSGGAERGDGERSGDGGGGG